jgi:hypothetical protein
MDGPSRPPYRLDLDNGPVQESIGSLKPERDFRRLRFSFFRQDAKAKGIGPVAQVVRAHA